MGDVLKQGNLLPEFGSLPWALKPLLVLVIERGCSAKSQQRLLAAAAIITAATWLLLCLGSWMVSFAAFIIVLPALASSELMYGRFFVWLLTSTWLRNSSLAAFAWRSKESFVGRDFEGELKSESTWIFLLRSWHSTSGSALLLATALVSLGSAVVDGLTDGMISAESTEATAAKLQSLCQTGHSIGLNAIETLSKTKRNNPKQLFHVISSYFVPLFLVEDGHVWKNQHIDIGIGAISGPHGAASSATC